MTPPKGSAHLIPSPLGVKISTHKSGEGTQTPRPQQPHNVVVFTLSMKSKKQGLITESQPVLTKIPKSVSIASWHRSNEAASPQKMNCIYLSTLHIQEHCKDSFRALPSALYGDTAKRTTLIFLSCRSSGAQIRAICKYLCLEDTSQAQNGL